MQIEGACRIEDLINGTCYDPHSILGMHPVERNGRRCIELRVWVPGAIKVSALDYKTNEEILPLERVHEAGFFIGTFPTRTEVFPYRLRISTAHHTWVQEDPYRFLPTIGELDLYYIGEGTHRKLYEVLGAHLREIDGVKGVSFAVWAPNARGVSVIGDFNGWDKRRYPMRVLGSSGVWEIFLPGVQVGEKYKYAINGADGIEREKADPLAFYSELRPRTASIIYDLSGYKWKDREWMLRRLENNPYQKPMNIYEVHLGSWKRHPDGSWLSYRELADELVPYVKRMGFNYVEFMPLLEHPYDGSWGYQVTGFYSATSRFGTPDDLRYLIDRCHQAGIGVIIDWVPAHFAVDEHGLCRFDGTYLYEHEDIRRRFQPDWGTFSFNYGRNEVRNFLTASALFWVKEFHVDGLRVDGVSSMLYLDYSRGPGEWTPNKYGGRENLEAIDFLREMNSLVYAEGEGAITIAEESTAWPGVSRPVYLGGLGFGFKWNMGWMHDTLEYFRKDPIYRKYHHNDLTFSMVYAYNENFILSLSHDEVVHGKGSLVNKMPGDEWQQFANLRLLFAYQWAHPGKKLIFMGDEFGQRSEWNHDWQLDWWVLQFGYHQGVQRLLQDLNRLYLHEPALYRLDHDPKGFTWLDYSDWENSVISFARWSGDGNDHLVCAFNFTPVPRYNYRIPAPHLGKYREVLNTDAQIYGGSGIGNMGEVSSEVVMHNGHPYSVAITLPPLGAVFFKPM